MLEEWERVAVQLYAELGCPTAPLSAFALARDAGFDVVGGARGQARLIGDALIQIDHTLPVPMQHWQVAREVGRWALFRAGGLPWYDEAADHVASALLLPRVHFLAELGATLDPVFHAMRNPNVPFELIARRTAVLGDVLVSTWRGGKLIRRFAPGVEPGEPRRAERELARRARTSTRPVVHGESRAYAVHETGPLAVEVISYTPARVLVDLSDASFTRLPEVLPASQR
jgi:hypothetical protein